MRHIKPFHGKCNTLLLSTQHLYLLALTLVISMAHWMNQNFGLDNSISSMLGATEDFEPMWTPFDTVTQENNDEAYSNPPEQAKSIGDILNAHSLSAGPGQGSEVMLKTIADDSGVGAAEPNIKKGKVGSAAGRAAAIKRRRRANAELFMCPVEGCGGKVTSKQNLLYHLDAHRDIKRYRCPTCKKLFRSPGDLKRHERTC
ncbi:hypothetical protein BDP27DRAFT_1398340 [Rhodocollybia butyracea]|uniref:C2H2-type domain-containing protein n=1 Tax=Rhodocollybia butyracea TaxID=206335 RepID=A0A9P5Q6J7_9AGAR|nr:hypothetical protein BDP27DRAFT_1398340 [Rhodocollybia butyracea]